ncbi:MAG: iron-sulfur cluster repair di-iron protein, ric [Clostridium sp.]|nr:iron-sulfur cluster repair di-iron protein, ric [Clostridium sp.]
MTQFNEVKEKHIEKLELYVPVVARVHGDAHPEFHKVHEVYNEIIKKIKKAGTEKPDLNHEFKELRKITDNYTIPKDTCESYEAVYNMLSELDSAYNG